MEFPSHESNFEFLAERARTHLERIPELAEKFKKSLLADAFSGELTREWRQKNPEVEPAGELLERIRPERRRRWVENYAADRARKRAEKKGEPFDEEDWQAYYEKKSPQGEDRYEEPEPVDPDEEDLPEIPETWEWGRLEELVVEGPQNGLYEPKSAYGSGIPIIRIEDYQTDWLRERRDLKSVETSKSKEKSHELESQDLLIDRVNSPTHLGKSILIPPSHEGCLFESNMMRLKLAAQVIPQFVTLYCNSPDGKLQLTQNAKWAVNQASINQDDVLNALIPLAPIAEQQAIARKVEKLLKPAEVSNQRAKELASKTQALESSLLADAFSG